MKYPPKNTSTALYNVMLRLRLAEQKVVELYPSDKIQSPVHLSVGQEGVSAGVCVAMRPQDRIYGTYRGHGLYVAKGGAMNRMFAELYAKDTGCARGKGGSMHLVAPEAGLMGCSAIVGSTIPIAVGDALASEMRKRPYVVVAFFGDGAIDEGVFYESVNFAVLKNLPVVFVLENNFYAIHSRLTDRRRQTDLYRVCDGLGLKGRRFDGDDVFAVYDQTRQALEKARRGGGPALLEFTTYRWQDHVGIGSDLKEVYRRAGESGKAAKSDPVGRARVVLKKKFKIPDDVFKKWEADARAEVEAAVSFAEKSPFPPPERLLQDLFA